MIQTIELDMAKALGQVGAKIERVAEGNAKIKGRLQGLDVEVDGGFATMDAKFETKELTGQ